MPNRLDDSRPPYRQVAEQLRQAIERGEYQPGDRLPGRRQLAQEYGIAPGTAQHALDLLRAEGLVVAQQGRGTVVRDAGTESESQEPAAPAGGDRLDEVLRQLKEVNARLDALEGRAPATEPEIASEPDPTPGIEP